MNVIEKFFNKHISSSPEQTKSADSELHELNMATAALLFEVVRADQEAKDEEITTIREALEKTMNLSPEETEDILQLAEQQVDAAVSLYEFTKKITDHFDSEQRISLIRNMWRVAYADSELHKYEEYLIRKVAGLIHVPQDALVRTRQEARADMKIS